MENQKKIKELFKEFKTSPLGLSQKEANQRVLRFGFNSIGSKNRFFILKNVVEQLTDLLVLLLVIAGLISFVLGDAKTTIVMFSIVFINGSIGFWQQYRTEKTLLALKNLLPHKSQVLRDGKEKEVLSSLLVPGDIIVLQNGDSVPADGRIIESYSFKTNEASLTGESHPQLKHEHVDSNHPYADKVFMGTTVLEGEAKVLVVTTGLQTEFGKIAQKTKETRDELSPLQKRLRSVGKTVGKLTVSIMVLTFCFEIIKNNLFDHKVLEPSLFREIFLFAMALAAALVPEGLPATVSVALSLGANRLIKRNAIVKKLASVETLGSTNVICTDKTGTLTCAKMAIVSVFLVDDSKQQEFKKFNIEKNPKILANWALCQNVKKTDKGLAGNADEIALYEAVEKKGFDPEEFYSEKGGYKKIHEVSFNHIRKMMSVLVQKGNKHLLFSKGNPQVILEKCKISSSVKEEYLKGIDRMAEEGLRVFAFAHRDFDQKPKNFKPNELEKDLILDGFAGIEDDIRKEVPEAIQYCHETGIKVVMITGDYKITALSTAKKINLAYGQELRMISGQELMEMKDLELRENLLHQVVFYQTDPSEKLRIVETLQKMGQIVAVTGDGVNDAMALKKADIGVAMGLAGTDVAKEAADMILLDDNFATIVNAIQEGRTVWQNLKHFLFYVFSGNAGEFFTIFLGTIFGLPLPMTAVQILSIDLGTTVLPSISLAADRKDVNALKLLVQRKHENLLGVQILIRLLYVGLIMGGGAVLNFWLINRSNSSGTDLYSEGNAAAFATLTVCQFVNVFEVRGGFLAKKGNAGRNYFLAFSILMQLLILLLAVYNPFFQNFLSTKSFPILYWIPIIGVGLVFLLTEEIRKRFAIKNKMVVPKTSDELA